MMASASIKLDKLLILWLQSSVIYESVIRIIDPLLLLAAARQSLADNG
jgi:hypothetical protein